MTTTDDRPTETANVRLGLAPTDPRPPAETGPLADRRKTNPLFNDQKMKLGLFGTNCSYGLIMSHAASSYEVTWEHTKAIAQRADQLGFEALIPVARWKGFGGSTNFNGNCFETYTWAAGLAEATEHIAIAATSHLPTMHPIVSAKQATTIDHISGGRFALNLVMGWVTPEMEMFGGSQREHDRRYAFGQEWIDYAIQLWTRDRQLRRRRRVLLRPGRGGLPQAACRARARRWSTPATPPSGIEFSARNVDVNFASLDTLENVEAYTSSLKEKAKSEYSRDIQTMTYGLVVCRDTEAEAKAAFQNVVDEGDWGAAGNVIKIAGSGASQSFDHVVSEYQERFIAGWGGYPIVGTPEQVTEELVKLNEAGMDGMIMGLIDYKEELEVFDDEILPLMKQAGIRH